MYFLLFICFLILSFLSNVGCFSMPKIHRLERCSKRYLFGFGSWNKGQVPTGEKALDPTLSNNFSDILKRASEVSSGLGAVQNDLTQTLYLGRDSTGQVTASFNGIGSPVEVKISDAAVDKGSDFLSKATTEAIISAHEACQRATIEKMASIFGSNQNLFK